jgi:hypothetical protein
MWRSFRGEINHLTVALGLTGSGSQNLVRIVAIFQTSYVTQEGIAVSLFSDSRYEYRDTYFVFLEKKDRPTANAIKACLSELGSKYQTAQMSAKNDVFESTTVISPYDFSAMDIAYVQGEEVTNQIGELMDEFKTMTLTGDDSRKLQKVQKCNARFDVFHFEQVDVDSEDEFLDPGGLLLVLERLARLCRGVILDPQSQTLM